MPAGTARKQTPNSLNRRRGTTGGGGGMSLRTSLALFFCVAIAFALGMLVMLLTMTSPTPSEQKPGVPNFMRGRIASVAAQVQEAAHNVRGQHVEQQPQQGEQQAAPHLEANSGEGGDDDEDDDERDMEKNDGLTSKDLAAADGGSGDDDTDDDEDENEEEEKHPQVHQAGQKRRHDHLRHNQLMEQMQAAVGEPDLNRYDAPPTKDYPYALDPVPADFSIAYYKPLGGNRFSEYTTGGTPYLITDELKQRSDDVARTRREHVKSSMQHAWKGYVDHAFGQDEILPQSGYGKNNWGGQAITLVDALDTLWLMGMKDEFKQARDWVASSLSHAHVGAVSVFETTIRDLGGLLAAYDWSRDQVFLDKALDLGSRLLKSFDGSSTGIPYGQVNLASGSASNIGWTGGNVILAEFGTLQVENRYLTKTTGEKQFAEKTEKVFDILHSISPPDGLFPYYLQNNPRHGNGMPTFSNNKVTFGAMADSVYEYMLKIWLQGGKTEPMYREMYDKAIDSMHSELLQTSTPSGLTFIADRNGGRIDPKMDHLVCFMGGLLALGAYTDPQGLDSERAQRDLRTGKALTYTCYQMYARMNTGISAEFVQFYEGRDFQVGHGAPHYLLRPEAVESFFILNYLTGDPVYREWGWEMWQSIEKYCKTQYAYGALSNVQDTNGRPRDKMESFFLAETLKYLYLLQDPDTEVDILHKHVFNTEAHPLRIFPVIDQETS